MVLGTQFWHVSESRYFCYCQGLNLIAIEPNLPGMVFLLYEAFHRATSKSGIFHEINHPAIFRGSLMTMETCIYSQFFSQIPMSPAMPPEYNSANLPDSLQKHKFFAGERRYSHWYQKTTGWWFQPTPLKNVKVNWDDKIPWFPNHQPD